THTAHLARRQPPLTEDARGLKYPAYVCASALPGRCTFSPIDMPCSAHLARRQPPLTEDARGLKYPAYVCASALPGRCTFSPIDMPCSAPTIDTRCFADRN
ncbi:MAG: hypothetical protein AAF355_08835, partial [Myxococcota bacterium]